MYYQRPGGGIGGARLIIALLIAAFALFRYFSTQQLNAITGEKQHISIRPEQEIALGLQAKPEMEAQFGGESNDPQGTRIVKEVGQEIVAQSDAHKTPYKYDFHLLQDDHTVNAFALPGG